MLTDQEIFKTAYPYGSFEYGDAQGDKRLAFAHAIEAAATAPLLERIAELEAENHNLNWALGTEGFDQMATPEEQAEHEKGHAAAMANIARIKAHKERHDQLVPDGVDYLDHIAALTAQVDQAAQPVFWAPPERANTYHSQATETVYRTPMAGWRPLYTAPPKAEQWHVGDSGFESWYGQHLLTAPVHRGAKQLARDAYAAGMGERQATAPPKAVPLTDEQVNDLFQKWGTSWIDGFTAAVRAIEAHHGITPATVEKERE